jgi:very-short-patch-repair endonuclease
VHVDRLIGAVADRQAGVVTRAQLLELGLQRGAISWRIASGLLHLLHRGVYRWGHSLPMPFARFVAAVYACGEGSVLTRHAAAAGWEFRPEPIGRLDVTIVGDRRVRIDAIRTHRTASFSVGDLRTLHGIPITSPARTLLDIAGDLPSRELAAALEQAQIKRLVTRRDLEQTVERASGRAGIPALRALIAEPAFTRSEAERRLVALLAAAKLARPAFNHIVEGFEVDAVWRPERIVLEFDSYAFHATRAAFIRDRRKDAQLTRAGYLVLRTTWHELTNEPFALIARIAQALHAAPSRAA